MLDIFADYLGEKVHKIRGPYGCAHLDGRFWLHPSPKFKMVLYYYLRFVTGHVGVRTEHIVTDILDK